MMEGFLISTSALGNLCETILSLTMTLYLLFGVRNKSRATWWLILTTAGWGLHFAGFLMVGFVLAMPTVIFWNFVVFLGAGVGTLGGIGFAYEFSGNPFRRESRLVIWGILLFVSGLMLSLGYQTVLDLRAGTWLSWWMWKWISLSGAVMVMWMLIVHLRQAIYEEESEGRTTWSTLLRRLAHPPTPAARAHRAFSLVHLYLITLLALITLRNAEVLPFEIGEFFFGVGYPAFLLATLIVYVNHAPVPSTFQVKLVGLSLFSVLAFLGAASLLLFPIADVASGIGVDLPSHERIVLEPDRSGYRATRVDADLQEDLGVPVTFSTGRSYASVDLGFEFPFAGRGHRHVYVFDNALIGFDSDVHHPSDLAFPNSLTYSDEPWITPLIIPPGDERRVFIGREAGRVVFTWLDKDPSTRVQTTLAQDGRVIFDYGASRPFSLQAVRGLSTGRRQEYRKTGLDLISASRVAPSGVIAEDYRERFRHAVHPRTARLFWLILAASAFILGFFPFFYRGSLVRPLERLLAGVRRVNDGDLKTEVPVTVRDEIGLLTNQFNRMTGSLRRADEDLRTYADTLEQRVEERTAELAEKNDALEVTLSELKATQAQLVQQEKLASLGALTAGIAHEIKNPLNFVNNFAGLTAELADELDESLAAHPDARSDIEDVLSDLRLNARKIAEHGQRADGIVRSMLEHSRGTKGERQATDLNTLLEEYVNLAYHGMRAQNPGSEVTIERDYDASIEQVEVVPQEMGRVFLNLLNNAFHAVYDFENAPTVRVSTHRLDGQAEVRIADNGPGIPAAIRKKIFEPFFTTKPAGSGTGLGLSLSHDIIVNGHGGQFVLESEEGRGACFIVRLQYRGHP